MVQTKWSDTEKKVYLCMYGIVVAGLTILAISHFIEACRSRPKVMVLGLHSKPDPEKAKSESSSAEK